MLTVRNKIFIIISIIVGVILSMLLFYFFVSDLGFNNDVDEDSNIVTNTVTGAVNNNGSAPTEGQPVVVNTNPLPDNIFVKQVAKNFVERSGSYSNQNNNAHIDEVLSLVTDKVATWLKSQMIEPSENYYGVTTKVIASSVKNLSGEEAVVEVGVQRIITEDSKEKTEYATGNVNLVNIDGEWMIDGLFW
jgi:hypothetical protein